MKKIIYCLLIALAFVGYTDKVKADCNSQCYEMCSQKDSNGVVKNVAQSCLQSCTANCKNDITDTTSKTYKKVQCGDVEAPYIAAQITRTVILVLQIATPVIIIIRGSIDLVKSVIAQKEDEIRKGRYVFLRRLITGCFVFLIFVLVKAILGFVAPTGNTNMWNCVDCFVNGNCTIK